LNTVKFINANGDVATIPSAMFESLKPYYKLNSDEGVYHIRPEKRDELFAMMYAARQKLTV